MFQTILPLYLPRRAFCRNELPKLPAQIPIDMEVKIPTTKQNEPRKRTLHKSNKNEVVHSPCKNEKFSFAVENCHIALVRFNTLCTGVKRTKVSTICVR